MSDLILRDARVDEHERIAELTRAAYGEYADVMAPAAWAGLANAIETALSTTEPVERIVAELDDRLVGSVMLYSAASDAYAGLIARATVPEVRMLAVATDARGHGIGDALMRECVLRAKRAGAAQLGLHTSASMRAAIQLYERMGFQRAPEFDFRPDGAELVTAYRLDL